MNANPIKTHWTFSVDGTLQRSYISATVLTRQSGNFIYAPGQLNLLSNDQNTLTLQAQNPSTAVDWTATLNAGFSVLHSPNCSGTTASDPKCNSPYTNKTTWGINLSKQSLVLYANAAPGTQRLSSLSVSSTIPANNMQTTAVIAFHFFTPPRADSKKIARVRSHRCRTRTTSLRTAARFGPAAHETRIDIALQRHRPWHPRQIGDQRDLSKRD